MKKLSEYVMLITITLASFLTDLGSTEQCGRQNREVLCPNGLCCSQFGWCGTTDPYCGNGCQSQCAAPTISPPLNPGHEINDITTLISTSLLNQFLLHRDEGACPARGFYTYGSFISAAKSFPGFCTTGDASTRKRELAAFFGQTSHETSGGWTGAPDGAYSWGYCNVRERVQSDYCTPTAQWPCAPDRKYYGRGPIQLTHNYNYGQAGKALGIDLINNPDLVAIDPIVSFKTAIWFWMTPQGNKPSCHSVITGQWTPSDNDQAQGRVPGYGVITNIINGGIECGRGQDKGVIDRIGFYKRYCDILGVSYGNNLDCNAQTSF